jgi:hypothetical protein
VTTNDPLLDLGLRFEDEVAARLKVEGWEVAPFGQALFPEKIRSVMRQQQIRCMWRWLPDHIVAKGDRVYLVDSKTSTKDDYPNYAIAHDSYHAHHCMSALGLPIVYVFKGGKASFHRDLRVTEYRPPQSSQNGSGTPFVLVPKNTVGTWQDVFGDPTDEADFFPDPAEAPF